MKDQRITNIVIFEDTEEMCLTNMTLKNAIEHSLQEQRIYREKETIEAVREKKYKSTEVKVSCKRSFEAAKAYQNKKVCVHNFASATNPGGGVIRGASAQEECLCRASTLFFNLNAKECWDKFYAPHRELHNPIYNEDCIYTPEVMVFKEDTDVPLAMPEEDWYKVNVLTCAAPNLREQPSNCMNPHAGDKKVSLTNQELFDLHVKRGRRILDVAAAHGNEVIILGAFGCGAFKNPPEVVAAVYRQLMKEYDGAFETVEFAVYCTERDKTNYEVFQSILG